MKDQFTFHDTGNMVYIKDEETGFSIECNSEKICKLLNIFNNRAIGLEKDNKRLVENLKKEMRITKGLRELIYHMEQDKTVETVMQNLDNTREELKKEYNDILFTKKDFERCILTQKEWENYECTCGTIIENNVTYTHDGNEIKTCPDCGKKYLYIKTLIQEL